MATPHPTFRDSMLAFWGYTLLRFALFGVLWAVLWLVGVGGFLGAIIALALSVPLSWVLLRRPRAALAANIEQRVSSRVQTKADLNARLDGEDGDEVDPPHSAG